MKSIIGTALITVILVYAGNYYYFADFTKYTFTQLIGIQAHIALPFIIKGLFTIFGIIICFYALRFINVKLHASSIITDANQEGVNIIDAAEKRAQEITYTKTKEITFEQIKLHEQIDEYISKNHNLDLNRKIYTDEIENLKLKQIQLKTAVRNCYLEKVTKLTKNNPKGTKHLLKKINHQIYALEASIDPISEDEITS